MNPSPTRDLTPVVPKRLRSDYTIAMFNYFLLGLALPSFAAFYYFSGGITYSAFTMAFFMAVNLAVLIPIISFVQREFTISYKGLNLLAYIIILLLTLLLLTTNYFLLRLPLHLFAFGYGVSCAILVGNNRALIANLGPPSTMARRFNLAQTLLPLGLIANFVLNFFLEAFISSHALTLTTTLLLLIAQIRCKAPNLEEWDTASPEAPRPLWKRLSLLILLTIIMLVLHDAFNWIIQQQSYTHSELAPCIIPCYIATLIVLPFLLTAMFKHTRTSMKKLMGFKKHPIALIAYIFVNTALFMAGLRYLDNPYTDLIDPCLILITIFLGCAFGAKRLYSTGFGAKSIIVTCVGLTLLLLSVVLPEFILWSSETLPYALPLSLPLLLVGTFLLTGFNNAVLSYSWQGMDTNTRNLANYAAQLALAASLIAAWYLA